MCPVATLMKLHVLDVVRLLTCSLVFFCGGWREAAILQKVRHFGEVGRRETSLKIHFTPNVGVFCPVRFTRVRCFGFM